MPDYTELAPENLKPTFVDSEGNLKPSITTSSYTGGTPTSAADIKPGWIYPDGMLREGLVLGDYLKDSLRGDATAIDIFGPEFGPEFG